MLPELLVVFTLPTPDATPALADQIHNDDISSAEYYLHVEATQNIMSPENPEVIDAGWGAKEYQDEGMGLLEVYVQFGDSGLDLASKSIERAGISKASGEALTYATEKHYIEDMNADELMDRYDVEQGARILVSHERNSAMWVEALRVGRKANDFATLTVLYRQVDGDRALTIRSIVLYEDASVDELIKQVESVVERYRDLPMRTYTGAVYL